MKIVESEADSEIEVEQGKFSMIKSHADKHVTLLTLSIKVRK